VSLTDGRLGIAALFGASAIVGLAALVRIADPTASGEDLTGVIRLPRSVTATVSMMFGLAALVALVAILGYMRTRRRQDDGMLVSVDQRPTWLQNLAQILSLVNVIVIAYLVWKNVLPLAELMLLGVAAGSGAGASAEPQPTAPFLVNWTFAILALAAGATALGLAIWFASAGRLSRWLEDDEDDDPAPPPLVEAVEESLEDLRAETDPRRAITRCYARFERAAAASGLERMRWQTPLEFMRATLERTAAPAGAVIALTGLFELARFSDRPLGPPDRDRALAALDEIKAAIEQDQADAVAV
jgi:hypothetical protein